MNRVGIQNKIKRRLKNHSNSNLAILTLMIAGLAIAVAAIVMFVALVLAMFGWAFVTIISLFTAINVAGFWAYAGIGLAITIVVKLVSN